MPPGARPFALQGCAPLAPIRLIPRSYGLAAWLRTLSNSSSGVERLLCDTAKRVPAEVARPWRHDLLQRLP